MKPIESNAGMSVKKVTYDITGHISPDVRDCLQTIADQLHDHLRSWSYDNEEEAYNVMHARQDYILQHQYHPTTADAINEHVSFVIIW